MRFERYLVVVLWICLLIPLVLSVSFSLDPFIVGENITTSDDLHCSFNVSDSGYYNLTWFNGSNSYTSSNVNGTAVTDEVITTTIGSGSVPSSATRKDQSWECEVTLYNDTINYTRTSNSKNVENTDPDLVLSDISIFSVLTDLMICFL